MYYSVAKRGHLCDVTAAASDDERFIVTAYFTKSIKAGKELWRS
jgi:hypothetical protein